MISGITISGMDKAHILSEIKRTTAENGGKPNVNPKNFVFRISMESSPMILFQSAELGEAIVKLVLHQIEGTSVTVLPIDAMTVIEKYAKPEVEWSSA